MFHGEGYIIVIIMSTSFGDLYHDLCRSAKSGEHGEPVRAIFSQSLLIRGPKGVFALILGVLREF